MTMRPPIPAAFSFSEVNPCRRGALLTPGRLTSTPHLDSSLGFLTWIPHLGSSLDGLSYCQRWLGDTVEARQHQDRQQRILRTEIGLDRLVPFVARVPVAAVTAPADGHRGDAERHRKVGISGGAGKGDTPSAGDRGDRALGRVH